MTTPDRTVSALLGVALVVAAGVIAPWWARPGYRIASIVLLLVAAGAILHALRTRAPKAAGSRADATPIAAPTAPEDDLLDQLETLRTAQGELLRAKQATEAAMLAKDEFLATVSHEIRTPLNGVLPLLELVLSTPLEAEQRDHLDTAYRSAQEMLRIVDDILDYSKLDVGKLELESISLNLREVVDAVAQLMRRNAEAKGLRLDVVIEPNVRLAVRGDPVRLRQVLTNLVSNAIKFTERGSVGIRVSRHGETPSHHEILFAVRDTGIGVAPDAAAKLFQPFSQGDASITRAFGGTGLGLVICKRLVDLMGGSIGVRSEADGGSLFWFCVPLAKVVGDLPAQADLHGARALLVGSEDRFGHRLREVLSTFGLRTTAAMNMADALTKLRSSSSGTFMRSHFTLLALDMASLPANAGAFVRNLLKDTALAQMRVVLFGDAADKPGEFAGVPRIRMLPRAFGEPQLRAALDHLFADDATEVPAPNDAAVTQPESPPRLLGRVLLVEDNAVNLKVAQRMLALHGIDAEVAAHGGEALERMRSTRYDLVLMDCQMPVMDGYAAAQTRRSIEHEQGLPATPIIAMTANAMPGDRARCLASGMDDYLSKPLSRRNVEQMLTRWLTPAADDAGHMPASNDVNAPATMPAHVVATLGPHDVDAHADRNSANSVVLDADTVRELRELMGTDFALLVRIYLDETPPRIAALGQAAARDDRASLITHAHMLKSSSANLGAVALTELARGLEESLRGARPIPAQETVDLIASEYRRVAECLRALIDEAG
ncbi:ATP-binding protein [Dokdonella soli]|uniref:histidine kinase n=1 Tax=Dokdonella soli TaxID=529810 RepID=A0ABP3TZG7_9GAMM